MKYNFLIFFTITISKCYLENFSKVWNFGKVNPLLLKKAIVCP
jgi:hypothetical protein